MGYDGPRIVFWSAVVTQAATLILSFLYGRYAFARLPLTIRQIIILGRIVHFSFSVIDRGYRFHFIASCAPIAFAYRQALVTSGGPLLIGSILDVCAFLTIGSPVGPDRSIEDMPKPVGGFGYEIPLNFVSGLAIPEIEPSWAFVKAQAQKPLTRWLFISVLVLSFTSLCHQFWILLRHYGQRMYLSTLSAAFREYRDLVVWCCRQRFALRAILNRAGFFEYGRLDSRTSEIRLLRILPTRLGAHVAARLEVYPVTTAPAFEAISYRWRTGPKVPVLLNGNRFLVSQAVYFMLEGLRHGVHSRLVWIDAICINQEDLNEKQWQVLLIGSIYSSARRVICWLEYDPLTAGALSLMATLASEVRAPQASTTSNLGRNGVTPEAPKFEMVTELVRQPHHSAWAAVLTLLNNEWFSRVWVVQEAAKGRNVFLRHGEERLTWDELNVAVALTSRLIATGMNVHSSFRPQFGSGATPANIFCISGLREKLRHSPGGLPMGFLLRETQMFNATLSSDKVYGLLSLSTDQARKGIAVDYATPEDVVFWRAARYVLTEEQCLEYLMMAGTGFFSDRDVRSGQVSPPSWVPDRCQSHELPQSAASAGFQAFHTATHLNARVDKVECDYGERWVAVHGVFFDDIACVSPIFNDPYEVRRTREMTRLERTELLVSTVDSALGFAAMTAASMGYHEDVEVAWTVILIKFDRAKPDQVEQERRFRELTEKSLQAMKEELRTWPRDPWEASFQAAKEGRGTWAVGSAFRLMQRESALKIAVMPMLDKRLCRTSRGHLAVVPPYCKTGDQICVFAGANLPCVVRRRPQPRQGELPLYELLGACYVHGIMHGELSKSQFTTVPIILA